MLTYFIFHLPKKSSVLHSASVLFPSDSFYKHVRYFWIYICVGIKNYFFSFFHCRKSFCGDWKNTQIFRQCLTLIKMTDIHATVGLEMHAIMKLNDMMNIRIAVCIIFSIFITFFAYDRIRFVVFVVFCRYWIGNGALLLFNAPTNHPWISV